MSMSAMLEKVEVQPDRASVLADFGIGVEAEVAAAGGVAPVHHPVADLVRAAGSHGLVSTVAAYGGIIDEPSDRWMGGFATTVDDCCDVECVEPCPEPPGEDEPDPDEEPMPAEWATTQIIYHRPVTFKKCYACTARQARSRDMVGTARRRLAQALPGAIEVEVQTGVQNGDVNDYLGAPPVFDDEGNQIAGCQVLNPVGEDGVIQPMALGLGFSLLNASIVCCGQGGLSMLHLPTQAADRLHERFYGHETEILRTKVRRNIVVSYECGGEFGPVATGDTGETDEPVSCDGVGAIPTGNPNLRWLFGTGLIGLRMAAASVLPATNPTDGEIPQGGFDKGTNKVCYCATRTVGWVHDGCCCVGVLVDVCGSIE